MKIISVWNQKGGVGKSTLSLQLAAGFSAKGLKVGIADLDNQRTCLTFFKNAEKPEFTVFKDYPTSKPDLDILICDHSPERNEENDPASMSDLILIPVSPSAIDAWSTIPALDSLSKRHKTKRLVIINRFQSSRKLMADFIDTFDHDFVMKERSIYARTIAGFGTVFAPRNLPIFAHGIRDAKKEINELIKKIEVLL